MRGQGRDSGHFVQQRAECFVCRFQRLRVGFCCLFMLPQLQQGAVQIAFTGFDRVAGNVIRSACHTLLASRQALDCGAVNGLDHCRLPIITCYPVF